MKPRSASFYNTWGNAISQALGSNYPNITIKKVGSRERGDFERDSDLDFQFCLGGGTTKRESFYPNLQKFLYNRFNGQYIEGEKVNNVKIGGSGNVVNILFQNGGKISFALMDCDEL